MALEVATIVAVQIIIDKYVVALWIYSIKQLQQGTIMDINQHPVLQSPTNLRKESVEDDPLSMFLEDDGVGEHGGSQPPLPGAQSSAPTPPAVPPRPLKYPNPNINLNAKQNFPPTSKYNKLGSQNNNFEAINPNLLHGSPRRRTTSQPIAPNVKSNQHNQRESPAIVTTTPKSRPKTSSSEAPFSYNNAMINSVNPLTKFLKECVEKPPETPLPAKTYEDCIGLYRHGSYLKCIETAKLLLSQSSDNSLAESASIIKLYSREWIDLNFLKLLSYGKLNLIHEARKIVETLGVLDQHLYRCINDEGVDTGSLVPFALRVEIAKASNQQKYQSDKTKVPSNVVSQNTADRLRGILALLDSGSVSVLLENGAQQLKALGLQENETSFLRLKLYENLIGSLIECEEYGSAQKLVDDILESKSTAKNRLLLILSAARVYMHVGDILSAERLYKESKSITKDDIDLADSGLIQARLGLVKGLIFFSKSKFEGAIDAFSEVIERCKEEIIEFGNNESREWSEMMVSCANNVGVCALMGGDPGFAVDLIESTLKRSMYCYTNIVLIRNLNILYSLLYSPRTAALKKQVITEAAKKFGIDLPTKEASI